MPFGDPAAAPGARIDRRLFWSTAQASRTLTTVAQDLALSNVVVSGIPAGAVISRALALFKYGSLENTNAAANDLDAAGLTPAVQVRLSTGAFIDGIDLVDEMLSVGGSARGGGDLLVGTIDVQSQVAGNGTYNFQLDDVRATGNNLVVHDIQTGLLIEWTNG
jgi:hypothetical protein